MLRPDKGVVFTKSSRIVSVLPLRRCVFFSLRVKVWPLEPVTLQERTDTEEVRLGELISMKPKLELSATTASHMKEKKQGRIGQREEVTN